MEDRYQLKITPAAAHDLDEIYYYITNNLVAPQAAERNTRGRFFCVKAKAW